MFGSPHFGYFGRFSDKLSPWRRSIRSPFRRLIIGGGKAFTCERTGEVISPLDCRQCRHYTLIEGEVDLRTCHYRSPEQLEVERENRRKTEEIIRRNEQFAREMDEEMARLEDRRRRIVEDSERMHEKERQIKEEMEETQRRRSEGASEEEGNEIEDEEKQEDDREKAFRDQEEEIEDIGDDVGDDTLHNSDVV